MKYSTYLWVIIVLVFLPFNSCSSDDFLDFSTDSANQELLREDLPIGVKNAVMKAYQLTDLVFKPVLPIAANGDIVYNANEEYQGVLYSSVKEIGTYIGTNVSFHTFMTAIHNPRSKIYTERTDLSPYHGINCKAYYGTTCSAMVSYALGVNIATFDFPVSDLMEAVDYSNIDSIHIADILWVESHVAMVTNVIRDGEQHKVRGIEISEAVPGGCQRYLVSASKFYSLMGSSFTNIYRYKEIDKNIDYDSVPEFVAVLNETPSNYSYNENLCADKGDKACYCEDEDVIINIFRDYDYLNVYKDGVLFISIDDSSEMDVNLHNLPYGDYQAFIGYGDSLSVSEPTCWKVVNMNLTCNRSEGRLYFQSANASAYRIGFSNISGSRKYPFTKVFSYTLTEEDRTRGYIEIPQEQTDSAFPYIHFFFSTEYGKIQHNIINWFE